MAQSPIRTGRTVTALVAAAMLAAACGGAQASPPPSAAAATPRATPNPHLPSPATAKQVYAGLGKAGLRITANTATLGAEGTDVVTKVYGTYLGWPFEITEYSSEKALTKAIAWPEGEAPGTGEPPIALAGSNILIVWGPKKSGAKPSVLSEPQVDGLGHLVFATHRLLSPLKTRTSVPVALEPTTAAVPSAAPAPKPD
jgi:hypothetical protein